jgi:hypothetical protein
VHALRPVAVAVAAAATVTLAAGCASFDRAFGKQEQVVQFKDNTPPSVMLKVRASCSHIPNAIPERVPPHPPAIQLADDIRYLTTNASDADLAKLEQCLQRFPSVVGMEPSSPDGS